MADGIFKDREHAMEATYFRQQDAKLLKALRDNAKLDEIAVAMAENLAIDIVDLLVRVRAFGVRPETAAAFLLVPLVQVAWADGTVSRGARQAVLHFALASGIAAKLPAYDQLLDWLETKPPETLFDVSLEVIAYGLAVLTANEDERRVKRILQACRNVATASGGGIARIFSLTSGVSDAEASVLSAIAAALRSRPLSRHDR